MGLLSSINVCSPLPPDKAAAALVLRSPPSVELDDQVVRLPASKLSRKIWSEAFGSAVGVLTTVETDALVAVAGTISVCVALTAIVGGIVVGAGGCGDVLPANPI
jgi:hypothetical protein